MNNRPTQNTNLGGISLIICAKNELANLKLHLPQFLAQEGIEFELILVNHYSNDGSAEFLNELALNHTRLKVIHVANNPNQELKGKRYPLWIGVQAASHDFIALSDADCWPNSSSWLRSMSNSFAANTDLVLGFSPYEGKKTWLSYMIQYETFLTALQYLSFAKLGFPYMGVGRNLAYRKSVLNEELFFKSNLSLGGDDDLLLAQIANSKNTQINIQEEAWVFSKAPNTLAEWIEQKKRHYNTAKYYSFLKILGVGGFGALNIIFYFILFVMLWKDIPFIIVFGLYLSKQVSLILINYNNIKLLGAEKIWWTWLCIDPVYFLIFLFNHLRALRKTNGWRKG